MFFLSPSEPDKMKTDSGQPTPKNDTNANAIGDKNSGGNAPSYAAAAKSGTGPGPGSKPRTGPGPGSKPGTGSGPASKPGTGPGPSSKPGTGPGPSSKPGTGLGPSSKPGTGTGPDSNQQTQVLFSVVIEREENLGNSSHAGHSQGGARREGQLPPFFDVTH